MPSFSCASSASLWPVSLRSCAVFERKDFPGVESVVQISDLVPGSVVLRHHDARLIQQPLRRPVIDIHSGGIFGAVVFDEDGDRLAVSGESAGWRRSGPASPSGFAEPFHPRHTIASWLWLYSSNFGSLPCV